MDNTNFDEIKRELENRIKIISNFEYSLNNENWLIVLKEMRLMWNIIMSTEFQYLPIPAHEMFLNLSEKQVSGDLGIFIQKRLRRITAYHKILMQYPDTRKRFFMRWKFYTRYTHHYALLEYMDIVNSFTRSIIDHWRPWLIDSMIDDA